MAEIICIKLILPLKLEWEPYYFAPAKLQVGDRVKAEFAGKAYVGVVSEIGVEPQSEGIRIMDIISVETGLARITHAELKLWRFMADYYLCSIGEVYKAAYPLLKLSEEHIQLMAKEREEAVRAKKIYELEGKVEKLSQRIEKKREQLSKARKDSVKTALTEDIEKISELLAGVNTTLAGIKNGTMSPKGLKGAKVGDSFGGVTVDRQNDTGRISLSHAQERAMGEIKSAFADGRPVLLHGVTGSGKTELYIRLAQELLPQGQSVLCLVPEIALSSQLETRVAKALGDKGLCFHSGQGAARRQEIATKLRSGAYFVLGTRSALFLPFERLGLVIIDEEQDVSYKQDAPAPRYNGRDCAVVLASIHNAKVLLGTATPSLESLWNCRMGRYRYVKLEEKYFGGKEAAVEVIDTIAERKKNGMVGNFSRKLISRIQSTLSGGGQVAVLRSRRAYSPLVQCDECGEIPRCPRCNVPLCYHKTTAKLSCRHCGYTLSYSGSCPQCGGKLNPLGAGTEKIEEELQALFPKAKVLRLDGETPKGENVKIFQDGMADILVGTQMIAKGLDFGSLDLVAVISADALLGQEDFRADERALQLLEQFRGRCGRRGSGGALVIQCACPSHPVYAAIKGEGRGLMSQMMEERRSFGYPPYTRLVNVILRDNNLSRLKMLSRELTTQILVAAGLNPAQCVGPYSPTVSQISGQHILNLQLKLKKDRSLEDRKRKIAACIHEFEKIRRWHGHATLNVDPL